MIFYIPKPTGKNPIGNSNQNQSINNYKIEKIGIMM